MVDGPVTGRVGAGCVVVVTGVVGASVVGGGVVGGGVVGGGVVVCGGVVGGCVVVGGGVVLVSVGFGYVVVAVEPATTAAWLGAVAVAHAGAVASSRPPIPVTVVVTASAQRAGRYLCINASLFGVTQTYRLRR
jgi:hypothetical protein